MCIGGSTYVEPEMELMLETRCKTIVRPMRISPFPLLGEER